MIHLFRRAQTEEYDYEKDEDDPKSDGEAEIIEKQSECNSSFDQEDKHINGEDGEINIQDNSERDYNEIIVEVVK